MTHPVDARIQAAQVVQAAQAVDQGGGLRTLPQDPTPVDPGEYLRPWERLPRETDRDWSLFRAFLTMGYPDGPGGRLEPRDVRAMAEALAIPWTELAGIARGFDWLQRAGAWDRLVERRRTAADLTLVDAQRESHGRIARKMRTLAEMELDKLLARAMDPTTPALSPKEVLAMVDLTIRLERLFVGEAPQGQAGDLGAGDLATLDLADLEAMHAIVQRAKGSRKSGTDRRNHDRNVIVPKG